jgi:hypothetical protein
MVVMAGGGRRDVDLVCKGTELQPGRMECWRWMVVTAVHTSLHT